MTPDLYGAPLTDVRAVDFRAPERDLWEDESVVWDRLLDATAGLDAAGWWLAGASRSDAGGPDWSLGDHLAHLGAWQEIGAAYMAEARGTGRWPRDEEFDGGNFDTFNERLREDPRWRLPPDRLRSRLAAAHDAALGEARRLPLEAIRGATAWGWVFMVLHGHALDHLQAIEPWADALRVRQVAGDTFGHDPRGAGVDLWAEEEAVVRAFTELVGAVPDERWRLVGATPGWSLADHVGHLAAWMEEAIGALEDHFAGRPWRPDPPEGIEAWNARAVEARRASAPAEIRARLAGTRARVLELARRLDPTELRGDGAWGWTYDVLHGHVRRHLAMLGPWCARLAREAGPPPG